MACHRPAGSCSRARRAQQRARGTPTCVGELEESAEAWCEDTTPEGSGAVLASVDPPSNNSATLRFSDGVRLRLLLLGPDLFEF
mmetsp:Transcript_23072/g.50624  ORF Transcript_23072/g.50624 Transcript_23072/m.50624 type:complete len:84 (-) Transcript_23072:32-283(-)